MYIFLSRARGGFVEVVALADELGRGRKNNDVGNSNYRGGRQRDLNCYYR